uniref:NADH-ubiquinone oxidoreductase chain 2 n=1 Tax=Phrixothrix hirtus TaxID=94779 RepID=A0A0R5ZUB4_PHRHR|nr:NADH dehydrogenase subunit 2 [Phrixothrix hirtus]
MKKAYKLMFLVLLMISTLITISSYTWLSMWIGLEINILSMISLMNSSLLMNSPESMIKYYLIQTISSSLIMMCIIIESLQKNFFMNMKLESKIMILMNLGLLTKMGTAPFHFWLPEVVEGINWMNTFLILTWQKIAPSIIIMMNAEFNLILLTMILISMVMSGVSSLNQNSMRKILAYSSINHMGWMLSSMFIFQNIWLIYFCIYMILMTCFISILNYFKIFFINQLNNINSNVYTKMLILINLLSMGGILPFIGFFPKWLIIQALIENKMIILSLMTTILALIMIYIYIRISLSVMTMSSKKTKWLMIKKNYNSMLISIVNLIIMVSLILSTISFNMM